MQTSWKVSNERLKPHPTIMVVGCGGTGGFVAEGLCRLLVGKKADIILVDHDRVERHNLKRQCFYEADRDRFKSQVLAERLSRLYGREVAFSVCPYSRNFDLGDHRRDIDILIGCVDNAAARESIAGFDHGAARHWWIDAGNGQHSGQVLIGNCSSRWPNMFEQCFMLNGEVVTLPSPTVQQPSLLIPAPKPKRQIDCAQAVEADEQSPVINQAMAMLVLEMVSRFLAGTLDYMGVYIDLEAGSMSRVPVTPREVARLLGVKERMLVEVEKKPKKKGAKR